jgi:hypothetical protein
MRLQGEADFEMNCVGCERTKGVALDHNIQAKQREVIKLKVGGC